MSPELKRCEDSCIQAQVKPLKYLEFLIRVFDTTGLYRKIQVNGLDSAALISSFAEFLFGGDDLGVAISL